MSGDRQVPFFCPYCGEEDLRPAGSRPGQWECGACWREFDLGFVGLVQPWSAAPSARSAP